MKKIALPGELAFAALLVIFSIFYFSSLPQFVQGGDTGELVAAAFRLFVPHPPGYPLWVWLEHFWTHLFSAGSIFWRASLLNATFAWSALVLVGFSLRKNLVAVWLCLPALALSTPFREAAVLPDVFALHALILAILGSLYLYSDPESKWRTALIPTLFCVGLAHHLTIIFLAPVLLEQLRASRNVRLPFLGFSVGLAIAISLYSSLAFLQPENPFSWGQLNNATAIWHHFLRSDYGLLKLSPTDQGANLEGLLFFFRTSLAEISPVLIFSLWITRKNPKLLRDPRVLAWSLSILISLSFLLFSNVAPEGMGSEVLRRFHVMPLVLLILLCGFLIREASPTKSEKRAAFSLALALIVVLGLQAIDLRSLHEDSVFEDYASNLLAESARHPPAIVLDGNDNAYFAMRYLQAVENRFQEVAVISPSLLFHPWYFEKVRMKWPEFALQNPDSVWTTRHFDFESDLIRPNLPRFHVVLPKGFEDGRDYYVTFLGVGHLIEPGTGSSWEENPSLTIRTHIQERSPDPQAFSKGTLYSEYGVYYLSRGTWLYNAGFREKATRDWTSCLKLVPFAFPALRNLCKVAQDADPRCTPEELQRVRANAQGFFE